MSRSEPAVWHIRRNVDFLYHPWMNVVFSWIGYSLFAVILYACQKKGILRKRMHDVFPILTFALVCDFFEMVRQIYLIYNMLDGQSFPTTYIVCSLSSWLFCLHFLSTYIESFISIHRFIVRFCGKSVPVFPVYIGIGIIFAVQGLLVGISFVRGEVGGHLPFKTPTVRCDYGYILSENPLIYYVAIVCVFISMGVATILSLLTIIKGIVKKQQETDVAAFIFISSLSMAAMITSIFMAEFNTFLRVRGVLGKVAELVFVLTYIIQDFRFPLLCLLAMFLVSDVRGAVLPTISGAVKKLGRRQKVTFNVEYELCLESGEKIKEFEFDIASLD